MIKIQVFMSLQEALDNAPVMERKIIWEDSLQFPFQENSKVLKALYGKNSIIRFEIL